MAAWSSLEVAKLIAATVTPLAVVVVGWAIWNTQRGVIQRWETQQSIERQSLESKERERDRIRDFRLTIYREAAPLLNDIHTYHFRVGRWKELTPADVVEKKRKLDSLMYSHEALFSEGFFGHYRAFMREAFRGAGNHLGESRIRTQFKCRGVHLTQSADTWRSWFTDEDNRRNLCIAYRTLVGRLSEELLLRNLETAVLDDDQKLKMCPPMYDVRDCD